MHSNALIPPLPKALFDASLSVPIDPINTVTKEQVDELFSFFQHHSLFRWQDKQNNCEDRAHAIAILLNHWGIPNYKGWVFGGAYLKKTTGNLMNLWNYHVAPALPVMEYGVVELYILDPATTNKAVTLYNWADAVTVDECSYYLARPGSDYIFCTPVITPDNWHPADKQNWKWTMQGLAGINGVRPTGKAQLVFQKKRIAATEEAFKKLMRSKPIYKC